MNKYLLIAFFVVLTGNLVQAKGTKNPHHEPKKEQKHVESTHKHCENIKDKKAKEECMKVKK